MSLGWLFCLWLATGLLSWPGFLSADVSDKGVVHGRVLDETGSPIAAAVVVLEAVEDRYPSARRRLREAQPPNPLTRVRSHADGSFRLEAPGPGLYRVVVSLAGNVSIAQRLPVLEEPIWLGPVVLDRGWPFTVEVRDAAGRPAPRARVEAFASCPRFTTSEWQPPRLVGSTDGSGRVEWTLGTSCRVSAVAWSPQRVATRATVDGERLVTLTLEPGSGRTIEVLGPDEVPSEGVVAFVDGVPIAVSGPGGRLEVTVPSTGSTAVVLIGSDRSWAQIDLAAEGPAIETVRLSPPWSVAGRIVDREGGGVAGVWVWPEGDTAGAVRSAADGRFALTAAPWSGRVGLGVAADGFELATRDPRPSARRDETVEIVVNRLAMVEGLVVDADGEPIAGAFVMASEVRGIRRSGADGRFRLRQVHGGPIELVASAPGHVPARHTVTPGVDTEPILLVLENGVTVTGQVVDEDGVAIPEATLVPVFDALGKRAPVAPSEAVAVGPDGSFAISGFGAGSHQLGARAPGYASTVVGPFTVEPATTEHDLGQLFLAPEVMFEGLVVDENGKPVAGAKVTSVVRGPTRIWGPMPTFGPSISELVTDDEGRFSIGEMSAGTKLQLFFRHGDFADDDVVVEVLPDAPLPEFVLLRKAVLRGSVSCGGRPCEEAFVMVETIDALSGGAGGRSTRVHGDGAFEAEVRPGPTKVIAQAPGHRRAELDLVPTSGEVVDDLRFSLSPAATISGTVHGPGGAPVPQARVTLQPRGADPRFESSVSDASGQYRLTVDTPGLVTLEVRADGHPRLVDDVEVGTESLRHDLQLPRSHSISGRITDTEGEPIAGVGVQAYGTPGSSQRVETTSEGRFELTDLADGSYRITAHRTGYAAREVPLEIAGAPLEGVEVTLEPGAVLEGRVLGLDAEARRTVRVVASWFGSSHLDAEGRFSIPDVGLGEVLVEARERRPGGRRASSRVVVDPGVAVVPVEIVFETGVTVEARFAAGGRPMVGLHVALRGLGASASARSRQASTDSGGAVRFDGVGPGLHRLSVASVQDYIDHELAFEVGDEDRGFALDLVAPGLEVRLVDATGAPIAAVPVEILALGSGDRLRTTGAMTTDARGTARLPFTASGSYLVRHVASGAQAVVELDTQEPAPEVVLTVDP